jgi:hypothetical protein
VTVSGEITLIRVGETVINLANVLMIDLDWQPEEEEGEEEEAPQVVISFVTRGMDELDQGQNFTEPYREFFTGEKAEAIRKYLKKRCPDLLTMR